MGLFDRFFTKTTITADTGGLPEHIAIIPDGNGRWAQKRGLPRSAGHREGSRTLKRIVLLCSGLGIKYLTVYAFSTENWARPKSEVDALMGLLLNYLRNAEKELEGNKVRIRVIGEIKGLPGELQREIKRVETLTASNTGLNLIFALNYGGKDEMVNAVKRISEAVKLGKIKTGDINKEMVSEYLYTKGIPDPDLIIRTSGEKRASNFLLWQSAYSEFWFPEVLWPDFGKAQLLEALKEYQSRKRRYGGI